MKGTISSPSPRFLKADFPNSIAAQAATAGVKLSKTKCTAKVANETNHSAAAFPNLLAVANLSHNAFATRVIHVPIGLSALSLVHEAALPIHFPIAEAPAAVFLPTKQIPLHNAFAILVMHLPIGLSALSLVHEAALPIHFPIAEAPAAVFLPTKQIPLHNAFAILVMHLPIGLSALSLVHEAAHLNMFVAGLTTFSPM
jgi:hypothetical protein